MRLRIMRAGAALALALSGMPLQAEPVTLPAGMLVELELQHHVNSAYIHAGSPIYFRVASDIAIADQVLIRKGTLVTGKMEQANARGMVGRSGSMSLGVRDITAVDGTHVAVDADLSSQGRSRTGATVAWTLFWGVPGLITRGVNPYLERGTTLDAKVVHDIPVDPGKVAGTGDVVAPEATDVGSSAAPSALPAPQEMKITGSKFASWSSKKPLQFDIERNKDLKTVEFQVQPPAGVADPAAALRTVELVSFDGVPVPEHMQAVSATAKSVTFDGWSIVRFCKEGATTLHFAGVTPDGQPFAGDYQLMVKIKKKG